MVKWLVVGCSEVYKLNKIGAATAITWLSPYHRTDETLSTLEPRTSRIGTTDLD